MGCSLRPLCVTFTCQLGSASVGDQVEKRLVNARVVGELRMEGCGHDFSLAHGDGILIFALGGERSEEHTSELQSHSDLVCRLLLEKKKMGDERRVNLVIFGWELVGADGAP